MVFRPEQLVEECQQALADPEPAAVVADIVGRVLSSESAIDDAFENAPPGSTTLFSSEDLTVQRIAWPPGIGSPAHDHRMWAVVGVYRGEEHNFFHERAEGQLHETGRRVVAASEVLSLDASAIHSVANPSTGPVCGLHVYGGDIDGAERSQWLPDGTELPLAEARPLYRAMWVSARTIAGEFGIEFSPERQYEAFSAMTKELERSKAIPEIEDVRSLLRTVWDGAAPSR